MSETLAGRSDLASEKLPAPAVAEEGYFVKVSNGKYVPAAANPAGVTAGAAAALDATSGGNPWASVTIFLPDAHRRNLERSSGGRATLFYSADGLKTPCEVVLLEPFALSDVSTTYIRARANSTAYTQGARLRVAGGLWEVTTPGTTSTTAPTSTTEGDTFADGTAVLTLRIYPFLDVHPAFVTAGVQNKGWWVGRYQAQIVSSKISCTAGGSPSTGTIDAWRAACTAFGNGCRFWTGWDWSAIMMDAARKGITPVGNTNYGRSHKTTESQWGGIRLDGARPGDTTVATNPYTKSGTGGKLWTHNREEWGVADYVGNYWQWTDGYKLMDGQLYVAAYDNDPALLTTAGEASWIATGVFFDSIAAGDDSGAQDLGIMRLAAAVENYTASVTPTRDFATIKADTRDLDYNSVGSLVARTIKAGFDAIPYKGRNAIYLLGLAPRPIEGTMTDPMSAVEGYMSSRNNGERFPVRGGGYYLPSNAGPRACNFSSRRGGGGFSGRPVFPVL